MGGYGEQTGRCSRAKLRKVECCVGGCDWKLAMIGRGRTKSTHAFKTGQPLADSVQQQYDIDKDQSHTAIQYVMIRVGWYER